VRILVTGASGMLGSTLSIDLSKNHKVFATGNSNIFLPVQYKKFDLSSESYFELIEWAQPELIIHCAAITDGRYCNENIQEAFSINGFSTFKLLKYTDKSVKIIYISSDAVYRSGITMADENSCLGPESVYGKSKEMGEFFLKNSEREYLILRTTIVGVNYFSSKSSFVEWIIQSAKSNQPIGLFDDVLFSPISIWDFIAEVQFLIDNYIFKGNIFNLCGSEAISKYNFGKLLLNKMTLNSNCISKSKIENYTERSGRSKDQTLNTSLYQNTFNRNLPDINQTLISISRNYKNEKRH
jgi:dTDP-4-dehydrorhamnose reductase